MLRKLAEKNAQIAEANQRVIELQEKRIAELESQRENWRISSVCREKNAQIVALREALQLFAKLQIPKKPIGNAGMYSILFDRIIKAQSALSAPPPPVLPLEDIKPLIDTLQWYSDGWNGGNTKALTALEEFTAKHPAAVSQA